MSDTPTVAVTNADGPISFLDDRVNIAVSIAPDKIGVEIFTTSHELGDLLMEAVAAHTSRQASTDPVTVLVSIPKSPLKLKSFRITIGGDE